jgi:hypothetical protein
MKGLEDAFRNLGKRGVDTFAANVVSVDKTKGTCKVNDGEIDYTDVRLSSMIDGKNQRFYLYPKVGSSVLVSPIKEDIKNLYIEAYSEVESLDLNINEVQLQIDKDGFLLRKQNEDLKKLMDDLLKAILRMKFTTNQGPTIQLINRQEFVNINNRFNQFLKSS